MKHHDGAGLHLKHHILYTGLAIYRLIEVGAQHIPHNDFGAGYGPLQLLHLKRRYPAVGWPEQRGSDVFAGFEDILNILVCTRLPAVHMIMGMIAGAMPRFQDLLINTGVLHHIFPDAEKRATGIVFFQLFEDKRRGFRVGPVVEGEIYRVICRRQIPDAAFVQSFQDAGCFGKIEQAL